MATYYLRNTRAVRSHLVAGKQGVAGEVNDLRKDVTTAFSRLDDDGRSYADAGPFSTADATPANIAIIVTEGTNPLVFRVTALVVAHEDSTGNRVGLIRAAWFKRHNGTLTKETATENIGTDLNTAVVGGLDLAASGNNINIVFTGKAGTITGRVKWGIDTN